MHLATPKGSKSEWKGRPERMALLLFAMRQDAAF
jgi:hypothetical protein